jgi:carbon storage regulator CsrA
MLVLTRKSEQKIHLGSNITITILKIKGGSVRIGIEAPSEVRVLRAELAQGDAAAGVKLDESAQEPAAARAIVASALATQAASPLARRVASATSLEPTSPSLARPSAESPRRRATSNAANASDARAHGRGPASAADGFSAQARGDTRNRYVLKLVGREASTLHS